MRKFAAHKEISCLQYVVIDSKKVAHRQRNVGLKIGRDVMAATCEE